MPAAKTSPSVRPGRAADRKAVSAARIRATASASAALGGVKDSHRVALAIRPVRGRRLVLVERARAARRQVGAEQRRPPVGDPDGDVAGQFLGPEPLDLVVGHDDRVPVGVDDDRDDAALRGEPDRRPGALQVPGQRTDAGQHRPVPPGGVQQVEDPDPLHRPVRCRGSFRRPGHGVPLLVSHAGGRVLSRSTTGRSARTCPSRVLPILLAAGPSGRRLGRRRASAPFSGKGLPRDGDGWRRRPAGVRPKALVNGEGGCCWPRADGKARPRGLTASPTQL